jgi:hypothetical protein
LQPVEGIAVAPPRANLPGPLEAWRLMECGVSVMKVVPLAGDPLAHACIGRRPTAPLCAPARPSGAGY